MFILKKENYSKIFFSALFLFLGFLSGYLSNSIKSLWYFNLKKPFFTPPNFIFKYVWSILYILIGIFAANLLKANYKYNYLKNIFIFHMILNFSWPFIFFYYKNIFLALINLFIILVTGLYIKIKIKKNYSNILFPYIIWVSFAFLLNIFIYIKN